MEKIILCLFNLYLIKCIATANAQPQTSSTFGNLEYTREKAAVDAQALHDAIYGLGTDEKRILEIIPRRTNEERQLIRKTYTELLNADLIKDLKEDLSGHFKSIITALMYEPNYYLAKHIHKLITSIPALLSGSFLQLSEIFCTRTNDELKPIKEIYKTRYNKTIEDDMLAILPDDHQRLFLHSVLQSDRQKNSVNVKEAERQVLFFPTKAGECSPTNNPELMSFFANQTFDQILYVIALHDSKLNQSDATVEQLLQTWCDDIFLLDSYLTVVRYAKDPVKYFAEELHDSLIGLGTEDDKLIRIIVTHSETDLFRIKDTYAEIYKKPLVASIEADTSGYYKDTLKILIERSDLYKPNIDVRSKN